MLFKFDIESEQKHIAPPPFHDHLFLNTCENAEDYYKTRELFIIVNIFVYKIRTLIFFNIPLFLTYNFFSSWNSHLSDILLCIRYFLTWFKYILFETYTRILKKWLWFMRFILFLSNYDNLTFKLLPMMIVLFVDKNIDNYEEPLI